MALTSSQRMFVDGLGRGLSKKDAAIAAGLSPATASAAGSRMFNHPAVAAEIAKRGIVVSKQSKTVSVEAAPTPTAEPELSKADRDRLQAAMLYADPRDYLIAVMNDAQAEPKERLDAAKALMAFFHGKVGEQGKKSARTDAAAKAGSGKFAPPPAPKLVVNNK